MLSEPITMGEFKSVVKDCENGRLLLVNVFKLKTPPEFVHMTVSLCYAVLTVSSFFLIFTTLKLNTVYRSFVVYSCGMYLFVSYLLCFAVLWARLLW